SGTLDVIDGYGTDAEIRYYSPALLADDRGYFTEYQAILVYRDTLSPPARAAIAQLVGAISAREMIAVNARAQLDKVPAPRTTADFAKSRFGVASAVATDGMARRIWQRTV